MAQYTLHCIPISQPLSCGNRVEIQVVTLHLPHSIIHLYNLYWPRNAILALEDLFGLAATEPVLVVGDFNAHHPILASTGPTNEAGSHLSSALRDSHHITLLNDVAQSTHIGNGRLDLALISTHLVHSSSWSLNLTLISDHFGVRRDHRHPDHPRASPTTSLKVQHAAC